MNAFAWLSDITSYDRGEKKYTTELKIAFSQEHATSAKKTGKTRSKLFHKNNPFDKNFFRSLTKFSLLKTITSIIYSLFSNMWQIVIFLLFFTPCKYQAIPVTENKLICPPTNKFESYYILV